MNNKHKPLFIFLLAGLLLFTLSGCANRSTTSYETPLNEVAYLADIDIKTTALSSGSTTYSITASVDETHENKHITVSYGYYLDEAKKNFIELKKSDDTKSLTKESTTYSFELKDTSNNAPTNETQYYYLISVGTKLDEDAGLKAKDFRKTVITFNGIDFSDTENISSRYANTLYLDENGACTLNHIDGLMSVLSFAFGEVLLFITNIVGNKYWLGLLIFTILLRTLGWPIYAKSNSTSQGMSKIQPEMERIQRKYEGRTDQNSQMKQQLEMRELMKKNHVSMWGCLLPFAQMPIFIIVYQMVRQFACTPRFDYLDYKFLWADLGSYNGKPVGDIPLAIIVGVTMVASQLLSTYFQKRSQKKNENFYTKQANKNNKQANTTLIIMTVVMTGMMVWFAWSSAGMAFYWIIGNVYQFVQTLISKLILDRKDEKERQKNGTVRGRA